jgi:hypothetical protein
MGIELYQEVAALNDTSLNKQFLIRLRTCLESWKDTSLPKQTRLEEMNKAQQICELFIVHMSPNLPEAESKILLSIFAGISRSILVAISGEAIKFNDAISALNFIVNNIKE